MKKKRYGFGTTAVHGGEEGRFAYNPSSRPLYQTSTFYFENTEEAGEIFHKYREDFACKKKALTAV